MASSSHTPTPWRPATRGFAAAPSVVSLDRQRNHVSIAVFERRADRDLTIRAVNALPKVIAALEHAERWIRETCERAEREGTMVDTLASGRAAALAPIRAALSRAKGEA